MILVRAVFQAKVGKAQELIASFKAAMQQSDGVFAQVADLVVSGRNEYYTIES